MKNQALQFFLAVGLTVGGDSSFAGPFDGEWKVVYSCKGATGIYAESCASGARDFFLLDLWTRGDTVCGIHVATAHLHHKVDGPEAPVPSVIGTMNGMTANLAFYSAFGATGTAVLRLKEKELHWHVVTLDKSNGESGLPDDAVLKKLSHPVKVSNRECQLAE